MPSRATFFITFSERLEPSSVSSYSAAETWINSLTPVRTIQDGALARLLCGFHSPRRSTAKEDCEPLGFGAKQGTFAWHSLWLRVLFVIGTRRHKDTKKPLGRASAASCIVRTRLASHNSLGLMGGLSRYSKSKLG